MCVFRYRMFTDSWLDVLDRVNLCVYHWPPRMTEDKSKNHGVKLWAIWMQRHELANFIRLRP